MSSQHTHADLDGAGRDASDDSITSREALEARWARTSRWGKFLQYLAAWCCLYLCIDLIAYGVSSSNGLTLSAFLGLAVILSIPGQVFLGLVVSVIAAWQDTRLRPLPAMAFFVLAGFPASLLVSRLLYAGYWALMG